jgi:hypothetical protein
VCVHTHTAHLLPHASQHPVPVIDNNAVFNTRRPAWLPAAPLEYAHPPPPAGGSVWKGCCAGDASQLGTVWKGLYANAHCAALASEETNHTRKNGVRVSPPATTPPPG